MLKAMDQNPKAEREVVMTTQDHRCKLPSVTSSSGAGERVQRTVAEAETQKGSG